MSLHYGGQIFQVLALKMENSEPKSKLSDRQRARIERNRQRALLLRKSRLASHPYAGNSTNSSEQRDGLTSSSSGRTLDTGGGFLLDIDDQIEAENELNLVSEPGEM